MQDIFRAGIDGLSLSLSDALVNHLIRPVLLHSVLASAYPASYVLPPLRGTAARSSTLPATAAAVTAMRAEGFLLLAVLRVVMFVCEPSVVL